ncbi:hypothetical protein KXV85_005465, partial [Aspergillus fumigatus]
AIASSRLGRVRRSIREKLGRMGNGFLSGLIGPPSHKASEACMNAKGENIGRTAITVVARIGDMLIIQGKRTPTHGPEGVIGLDDPFIPRMGQRAIAHQHAHAARRQPALVRIGNTVDDTRNGQRVLRAPPRLALERSAESKAAVDIGEIIGLDGAVTGSRPQEKAQSTGH